MEGAATFGFEGTNDGRTYMATTHNAHREGMRERVEGKTRVEMSGCRCQAERIVDILPYTRGVATGTVGPGDAGRRQIGFVDMVVADGGGDDQLHATPFEQGAGAVGASANDEHIGVAHILGRDGGSR